jgi:hypothetical protein
LVETQALVVTPGGYRPAKAHPNTQVPPTMQAVLAARIDRARIVEALETLAADRPTEQAAPLAHQAMRQYVWDKAATYPGPGLLRHGRFPVGDSTVPESRGPRKRSEP